MVVLRTPLREGPWHPIRVLDFNTFRWNNASYIYMPVLITASRMRCHHLDACRAHPKKPTQKKQWGLRKYGTQN